MAEETKLQNSAYGPTGLPESDGSDSWDALNDVYINQFGDGACISLDDCARPLGPLVDSWINSHVTEAIHPLNAADWEYLNAVVGDFEAAAARLRASIDSLNKYISD
jgi:hypothetical protein